MGLCSQDPWLLSGSVALDPTPTALGAFDARSVVRSDSPCTGAPTATVASSVRCESSVLMRHLGTRRWSRRYRRASGALRF